MPSRSLETVTQRVGDEMEGLLVLGAIGDRVQRSLPGPAVLLKAPLEADDQLALSRRGRTVKEQEHPPPDVRTKCGRLEILHHLAEGVVDAKEVIGEEVVPLPVVLLVKLDTGPLDHVVEALVGRPGDICGSSTTNSR